jgi:hypothetical protein
MAKQCTLRCAARPPVGAAAAQTGCLRKSTPRGLNFDAVLPK